MKVSRRLVLKQLAVVSAGVAVVPSFIGCSSKPSLLFKNVAVTQDQEELLALLADTIIPKTTTPGAKDVSAHLFTAKMIDDCLSKKEQDKWLTGLNQFTELAKEKNTEGFAAFSQTERENFLVHLEEDKTEDDAGLFYGRMKRLTLRGYTTSEYFLTKQGFSLIPGRYRGCVPINNPS